MQQKTHRPIRIFDDLQHAVLAAQVDSLYRQLPRMLAYTVLVMLLVAFMLKDVVPAIQIGTWVAAMLIVLLARAVLYLRYRRLGGNPLDGAAAGTSVPLTAGGPETLSVAVNCGPWWAVPGEAGVRPVPRVIVPAVVVAAVVVPCCLQSTGQSRSMALSTPMVARQVAERMAHVRPLAGMAAGAPSASLPRPSTGAGRSLRETVLLEALNCNTAAECTVFASFDLQSNVYFAEAQATFQTPWKQ